MKLYYLLNYATDVEGYYIENASAAFKKLYPKKYIVASIENNKVWNVDKLDEIPIKKWNISYLFTYDQQMYKKSSKELFEWTPQSKLKMENWQHVIPADLDNYLIDSKKENTNVVIKIVPKLSNKDPRFINSIVIQTNNEFLKTVDLTKSFEAMIKSVYNDAYFKAIDTTEKWLIELLREIPFDLQKQPLMFGETIDDEMFKRKPTININNFVIGYSSRIPKLEDEFDFIKLMETTFSDFKATDIIVFDDYTNIVDRIEAEAKKNNIPYDKTETSIQLAATDFYKMDIDFEIVNFISC